MTIDDKLFRLGGDNNEQSDAIWNQIKYYQRVRCKKSNKNNRNTIDPDDIVDTVRSKLEEYQSFRLTDPKKYEICMKKWEYTMLPQLGNFLDEKPYDVPGNHPSANKQECNKTTTSYVNTDSDGNIVEAVSNDDNNWIYYYSNQRNSKKSHANNNNPRKEIHMKNPLYSIGGCELLPLSLVTDDKQKKNKNKKGDTEIKMLLTQLASDLIDTMEQWMNDCVYDQSIYKYIPTNAIRLPTRYSVHTLHTFHSIMGCPLDEKEENTLPLIASIHDNNNNPENISGEPYKLPSYLAICQMYFKQKLSDRQLPLVYFCPTTLNSNDDTNSNYKFGHEMKQWQVVILTSPNLTESRSIQDEYIQRMFTFYSSMLLSSTFSQMETGTEDHELVRIRVIPPDELEWNDARRVVVEGYMPSTRQYIILGSVSNKTDYITRSYQIQFIGGGGVGGSSSKSFKGKNKTKHWQYCHFVHVQFCSTDVALPWWLENNIINHHNSNDSNCDDTDTMIQKWGIGVPPCLSKSYNPSSHSFKNIHNMTKSILFIPFQRIWRNGSKKGKIIFQQFHPKPLPYHINLSNVNMKKDQNAFMKTLRDETFHAIHHSENTTQDHPHLSSVTEQSRNNKNFSTTTLSFQDIEEESICNSFPSFLPFISSNELAR